ncbi:MAG: hypothetical protein ACR2J8_13835, partial [Thermomicrobiales bacterium]
EDPESALATVETARVLLNDGIDTVNPPFLQTWELTRRGVELHRLGRLDEARVAIEESIVRKRREGNAVGIGPLLAHLGRLQQDLGLPRQAAGSLLAALSLATDLDDDWLAAHASRWLADLARMGDGDAQAIADRLDAALSPSIDDQGIADGSPEAAGASLAADPANWSLECAIARAAELVELLPERADIASPRFVGPRLE